MMQRKHTVFIGKAIRKVARMRGGGSALPGLVIERLDKRFMADTLGPLPMGVVLIVGTNGKTTTTKMVTELLRKNGLKVFTNKTGSNFTRGIVAALLGAVDNDGHLPYDIAVLELDEAYAAHFIKQVTPKYALVLNVMRDQLDRFGEIDHTARLLTTVSKSVTKGVVLNRDDPRVAKIAEVLDRSVAVSYFGAHESLHSLFVSDDQLHSDKVAAETGSRVTLPARPDTSRDSAKQGKLKLPRAVLEPGMTGRGGADVELRGFKDQLVAYRIGKKQYTTTMQLSGVYNFLNAAGALALSKMVLESAEDAADDATLVAELSEIKPAFGRGEIITVNDQPVELVLVKNPAGFRLALRSFNPSEVATMISINDQYADGRDMSWLWDVDFSSLASSGVVMVSGIRAYDMALRLQYDEVETRYVEPDLTTALTQFITKTPNEPKRIFCTYTAMLHLRRALKKHAAVEHIE